MVNPLIIKNVGEAVAKTDTARVAMDAKAAKSFASATKSIEETTKMGGFQQLENFSSNMGGLDPIMGAMNYLMTQLGSETIASSVGLMVSLIQLINSPVVGSTIEYMGRFVSQFVDSGSMIH